MPDKANTDEPVFQPLLNTQLSCVDCIFRRKQDYDVLTCVVYPNGKPNDVLDGGKCNSKMSSSDAMDKYGFQH